MVFIVLGMVFLAINVATLGYWDYLSRGGLYTLQGGLLVAISPICFLVSFFLGHGWKRKMPGCLLGVLSLLTTWPLLISLFLIYWVYSSATLPSRFPFKEVSPDKQTTAILECDEKRCFVIVLDKEVFHTRASVYSWAKGEWEGNDLFRLDSHDVGPIEFRRTHEGWEATPRDLIREFDGYPSD